MTKCRMCEIVLTDKNTALREDGRIRLDCEGKPWCISCTEAFDKVDWDEVAEKRMEKG